MSTIRRPRTWTCDFCGREADGRGYFLQRQDWGELATNYRFDDEGESKSDSISMDACPDCMSKLKDWRPN